MGKFISILKVNLFSLVTLLFLFGCQKEEKLKPNEAAGLSQTSDFDGSELEGNGNGSGGSGGSGNVTEYFSMEVDGVPESYNDPFYQSTSLGDQIVNDFTTLDGQIQITSFSGFEKKTYPNPNVGYFKSATNSYQGIDGELVIDSVTNSFVEGTFYCKVVNMSTSDTISITNGSFKVAK